MVEERCFLSGMVERKNLIQILITYLKSDLPRPFNLKCLNLCLCRKGISFNSDSVMRSVYYKYLHPKEVFVADGILVPDLARKKVLFSLMIYQLN